MSKLIFLYYIFIVYFILSAQGDDSEDCGCEECCTCEKGCKGDPNAHPDDCGLNCGRTCATYKDPPGNCGIACPKDGCECNEGYVLDTNIGKCVLPENCTKTCKEYEVYKSCGSACPSTCIYKSLNCPDQPCVAGCFCKKGLIRTNSGKCVKPDDCNKCVTNETYTDCGSACEYSCANYGDPIGCAAVCIPGRFCTRGYHRNDTGDCVLLKDCPARKCDENQYFSRCGPQCQPYCEDLGTEGCEDKCVHGCFCKKGFYLSNKSDKCISLQECPSVCPEGEIFKTCGPSCHPTQPSCDNRFPACNSKCSRSCFCPDGYMRKYDTYGPCIKKEQCPNSPCQGDENAEWIISPVPCPVTCQNKNPPKSCSVTFGCKCKQGLIQNELTKKCVKPNECPQ